MWAGFSICSLSVIIFVDVIFRNLFTQIVLTWMGLYLVLLAKLILLLNHAFPVFLNDRDWSSIALGLHRSWWLQLVRIFVYYDDFLFCILWTFLEFKGTGIGSNIKEAISSLHTILSRLLPRCLI